MTDENLQGSHTYPEVILSSPYFWNSRKVCSFLTVAHNQIKDRADEDYNNFKINLDAEAAHPRVHVWNHCCSNWKTVLGPEHFDIVTSIYNVNKKPQKRTNWRTTSVCDLLRVIRNKYEHNDPLPNEQKKMIGWYEKQSEEWIFNDYLFANYWTSKFPQFLPFLWEHFKLFRKPTNFSNCIRKTKRKFRKFRGSNAFTEFYPCSLEQYYVHNIHVNLADIPKQLEAALAKQIDEGLLDARYSDNSGSFIIEFRTLKVKLLQHILNKSSMLVVQLSENRFSCTWHVRSDDDSIQVADKRAFNIANNRNTNTVYLITRNILDVDAHFLHKRPNLTAGFASRIIILTGRHIEGTHAHGHNIHTFVKKLMVDMGDLVDKHVKWIDLSLGKREQIRQGTPKLKLLLHGVESEVSMLLPDVQEGKEYLLSHLSGNMLNSLLKVEVPKIGQVFEISDIYQERRLHRRDLFNSSVFGSVLDDIFVVTNITLDRLRVIANTHVAILTGNNANETLNKGTRIYLIESDTVDDRNAIMDQFDLNGNSRGAHLLRYIEGNTFQWLSSRGSFSRLEEVLEDVTDRKMIGEEEFLEYLDHSQFSRKLIIIADTPGVGKSEVLKSIALKLTSSCRRFVLFISMKDFVEHLGEGALSLAHVVSTITSFPATNTLETTLVEILMNHKLEDRTKLKLELMFDGFDEIVFEKRINAMLTLHIILTEVPSARVWVTMRDHMLDEIRIEFGTLGFKLEPFSKQIQINYLLAYWNKKFHSSNNTKLFRELNTCT